MSAFDPKCDGGIVLEPPKARLGGLLQFPDQRKEVVLISSHMLEGTLEVQGR
jgi:hypothetical protein